MDNKVKECLIEELYARCPDFDSMVADVEYNLKHFPKDWRKYSSNPAPFLCDILGDFGDFFDYRNKSYKETIAYVEKLVKAYLNN